MMKKFNIKKCIIIFLFICLCFIITDKLVKADTITNYSTRYYWCTSNGSTSTCEYTPFKSGTDNKVTLLGAENNPPTYSQYETFNGVNNLINVSLTSGSTYTFTINMIYGNLATNEFGYGNLYRFNTYKYFSAGTITNVSTNYSKSSNCYNYGGTQYCDYNVNIVYTIIPNSNVSSFYLGSYTTSDSTLGIDYHYVNSVTRVNSISYSVNNDSTIVNQNETIIDQNQTIIDKQQEIIDNQNENTDKIIEDNKKNFQTCRVNLLNPNNKLQAFVSGSTGQIISISGGLSYWAKVEPNKTYTFSREKGDRLMILGGNSQPKIGDYMSVIVDDGNSTATTKTFTNGNYQYILIYTSRNDYSSNNWVQLEEGSKASSYIPYGKEVCSNKLDEQTDAINGLNDNINDDNVTGATDEASDFFSSFSTDTFGLTSIITAPLNLIQSLTSSTCNQLHLPLPYLDNKYIDLPCMTTIYSEHFGTFFTMYQTITYGIIAYWVIVRIFNKVKDFKNPEHDEIEVVDL